MYRYEKTPAERGNEIILSYENAPEVVETYVQSTPMPKRPGQTKPKDAKPRRSRKGLRIFLILLGVLLAAAVICGVCFSLADQGQSAEEDEDIWNNFPWTEGGRRDDSGSETCRIPAYSGSEKAKMRLIHSDGAPVLTATEIYEKVNPAVVTVYGELDDETGQVGTGVIFTESGFVLTNAHVIEDCVSCSVLLDNGYGFEAETVGYDFMEDLAVLKIRDEGYRFPTVTFGDSAALKVGDPVYAIGNPMGIDLRGSFTGGMVSGLSREITVGNYTLTLMQTDAALNNGNSGGPLINDRGEVVGINTAKMQSGYASVEGLGFAIPTADALKKVNDLLTYGEIQPTPLLGLMVAPLTEATEDGHMGLYIAEEPTPGGSGDVAGIQMNDILISADGVELLENDDLLKVRDSHKVGDTMVVEVCRNGEHMTIEIILQGNR